jgi:3-oxoacyl-[acyl-carrier-protein] synthase III
MYINAMGMFVPKGRIINKYFEDTLGLTDEWLLQRTGIHSRSKTADNEDGYSMGIDAVTDAKTNLSYNIEDVDLIVSASYTILDTVGTLAHRVQRHFNITNAKAFAVTSACSSFVNGVEIIEGYFAMNKASKALIICSEENSAYNDLTNPQSGHLWGDAAVAVFISKERQSESDAEILDVTTLGLGCIGKGPGGVGLFPKTTGITMHDGRDVFQHACIYMPKTLEILLHKNNLTINDVSYFACHQANLRIVSNIANQWNLPDDKFLNNISSLGNTGSPSSMLSVVQNKDKFKKGDLIGLSVFGGGYSSGAMLIRF